MAHVQKSVATLRLSGDDLVPAKLSKLLGCNPTHSQTRGEVLVGRESGKERIAQTGMWRLETMSGEPENLDKQIRELLSKLTDDMDIWQVLRGEYRIDLFCGLFMRSGNEGLSISPASLAALGQRGIELALDIYGPSLE